jgi:hypothetical protein
MQKTTTMHMINEHLGVGRLGASNRSTGGRNRSRKAARQAQLESNRVLDALEETIEHLVEVPTVGPEDPELTWEERESAGIAELLRIHQDALMRPLFDAEFARSEQIVATLNAHRPTANA